MIVLTILALPRMLFFVICLSTLTFAYPPIPKKFKNLPTVFIAFPVQIENEPKLSNSHVPEQIVTITITNNIMVIAKDNFLKNPILPSF